MEKLPRPLSRGQGGAPVLRIYRMEAGFGIGRFRWQPFESKATLSRLIQRRDFSGAFAQHSISRHRPELEESPLSRDIGRGKYVFERS